MQRKLYIKNPAQHPTKILPNTEIAILFNFIAIIAIAVNIIALTLPANPSTPSVKFTALVAPNITNIVNGIYNHIGRTSS